MARILDDVWPVARDGSGGQPLVVGTKTGAEGVQAVLGAQTTQSPTLNDRLSSTTVVDVDDVDAVDGDAATDVSASSATTGCKNERAPPPDHPAAATTPRTPARTTKDPFPPRHRTPLNLVLEARP